MTDDTTPSESAPHLTTEEARAGATPHMARYALGFGLLFVVIAFVILLGYYMSRT